MFDMEIEYLFQKNCSEIDNTRIMMDEMMVKKQTSPLLLQANFFLMQNVGILFQNCSTKSWNSTRNKVAKLIYNQINAP
jgi:hypothetical protein